MADIKYFVKATVIRPQFYKENIRAVSLFPQVPPLISHSKSQSTDPHQIVPLNFLPIEPPRLGNPNEETYARRPHQFSKPPNNKKKGIFSRGSLKDGNTEPPKVTLDARLPNPSILTCNEPVPLRLILRKLTDSPDRIFLQMLQIELISFTKILAHDLAREEIGSWVIVSRSNMNMALGRQGDATGTDWAIDPSLWNNLPLPNSVAPSFETCNIERRYELEIRIGLMHGTPGDMKVCILRLSLFFPLSTLLPLPLWLIHHSLNSLSYLYECPSKSILESHPPRPFWMQWQPPNYNHLRQNHNHDPPGRPNLLTALDHLCLPDHQMVLSPPQPLPSTMTPHPVTRMQWRII